MSRDCTPVFWERRWKRAVLRWRTTNIRDFAANKYNRVDDYLRRRRGDGYGAEPVYRACKSVEQKIGRPVRTVYLTPQGRVLNQTIVEELAMEEELILLCGHYEGIDERVLEEVVTDYISIGDYVLTGGGAGSDGADRCCLPVCPWRAEQ